MRRPAPGRPALTVNVALAASLLIQATACKSSDGDGGPEAALPTEWGNASLFGDGNLLTYAFTLSPNSLEQLIGGAAAERIAIAELSVTGRALGPVGLRVKGLGGDLATCFQGGQQLCDKVSFKVRFDHVNNATTLEGVSQLSFHASQEDPSQLRERLAARLFADMRLFGPRVSHAFVTINGERKGLFAVVEEMDARFTADRWPGAGMGNLYRDAWPTEGDAESYQAHLVTNLAAKDGRRMAAFGQAMRTALAGEPLRAALDRFTDIDYLLRFLALDQVIRNEGVTTFYCDPGGPCGNGNYFWYETPTGPLPTQTDFWLLPGELAFSLRLQSPFDAVPSWDKPPTDCNKRLTVEGAQVMPAGCDVVFRALQTAGRPAYVQALDRLLAVWDVEGLSAQLDVWAAQIDAGTRLDPVGPGGAAFRVGVTALKRDLHAFRERISALRDDRPVVPWALAAPGTNDFEGLTTLPFVLGATSESNVRSGAVHRLNGSAPLGGAGDLVFEFELANDNDRRGAGIPYSQFALLRLPTAGPTRLTDLTRIRLRARAEGIRNVRLEIDSAAHGDDPESPRWGWDLLLGRQPTEFVLEASKLSLAPGAPTGGPGLQAVLDAVVALTFVPEAAGRDSRGLLGAGRSDPGFLQIDDLIIEAQ